MEITGIIKRISDTETVSDKYKKREFVLTTEVDTKYPQHTSINLSGDKCELINGYKVGDSIKVSINIRGREWQDKNTLATKYFNTIEAWKIEKV